MSQRYLGGIITANPTAPTMTTESGVWTLEQQFQYSNVWSPEIVGNSLRFRSSASAYLNRTPASASNRKTWTFSAWVKRGDLSGTYNKYVFSAKPSASIRDGIYFGTAQTLSVFANDGTSALLTTTQVFRDPSAWYHIVVAVDTTQATSSNRIKVYVNGVQVTAFGTATYPSLDYQWAVDNSVVHTIGDDAANAPTGLYNYDGYMAEIYFVDGQALTPSSFGAFDSNGVWQPLPYTGTFGTNGFYVDFSDNSGTTSTTLGKDYSGNGNNWTPNNFSLTAGVTYDWMLDTPTPYGDGGNGRGNYAVLNPLDKYSAMTVANGNLQITPSPTPSSIRATIGVSSGKFYWEVQPSASGNDTIGIEKYNANLGGYVGSDANGWAYYSTGSKVTNSTVVAYGASFTSGDTVGVALDMDAGTLTFYKNNTSQGVAYSGLSGEMFPALGTASAVGTWTINFGQRPFAYTPPTGFKALNTQNLPVPNITNGAQYMAATLWAGTGATQSISNGANNTIGTTFKPDLVWIKDRTAANYPVLFNSIVGGTNYLVSSSTQAETGAYGNITFNSNGFTESTGGTGIDAVGTNAHNYVGWQWQAGQGTTSSNTSGSITSTTSVNATAGFSIVTYTGTGANATVGHGLGVAPKMLILKQRNAVDYWPVYHASLANTEYVLLNSTNGKSPATTYWNSTSPTSTVFSLGTDNRPNGNGTTMVAYCWAAVAGYSAFGSYTGNGSADGPFVYCGFRPRYVMIKRTDSTGYWIVEDSSRNTYNVVQNELFANSSDAEYVGGRNVDFLSNGFKIRHTDTTQNASGGTYIFAAFAENPFQISRAR